MRSLSLLRRASSLIAAGLASSAVLGCAEDIPVLEGPGNAAGSATGAGGAGTGGTAGASTGGPSTGPGAGGGSGACASLALAGPPVYVEPPNAGEQSSPALTLSRDDAAQASVAFQHTPYVDLYAPEISYASFAPWGAWPSALGSSGHAIAAAPASFVVSRTAGDSFNVLSTQGDQFASGTWFVPRVVPQKTPPGSVLLGVSATRVPFVATAGSRHLLGVESAAGQGSGVGAIPATSTSEGAVDVKEQVFLGCANGGPMPADAVASGTAWLVAFANGASSPGCFDPELPGPPHAIHVVRILEDGTFTTGAMLPQGGPIAQIAMAEHSDGAWLVWQKASGGKIAPIQAARLDAMGDVVLGPVDVVPSEGEPVSFGIDRLGDDLAIAWGFAGLNARAPGIVAGRVRDDGVVVASASLDGPILTGPPSVLGAPGGDQILVGLGILNDHPEVAVARFDCASMP